MDVVKLVKALNFPADIHLLISIFLFSRDTFWTLNHIRTKWIVGLGANHLKTANGFLTKQMETEIASYLIVAVKLRMKITLNLFLDERIVIILIVCYYICIFIVAGPELWVLWFPS